MHQLRPRQQSAQKSAQKGAQQGRPGQRNARRTHQEATGRRRPQSQSTTNTRNSRGGNRRGGAGRSTGTKRAGQRPQSAAKRPNYALRRLLAGLILLGITALIVLGVMRAAAWLQDTIRTQNQQSAAASVETFYPDPVECTVEDLDAEVSLPDSTAVGSGLAVQVTFTNTGTQPCLLDIGGASLGGVVTSGEDTIWESGTCPASPEEKLLLIDVDDQTSAAVSWDGNRSVSDCSETGEQAQAGTYRIRLTLGEADLTDERVFLVESETADDADDEETADNDTASEDATDEADATGEADTADEGTDSETADSGE